MENLNICILQPDIIWEDKFSNLSKYDMMLEEISDNIDLIILPEMFQTGFTMSAMDMSENMEGPTIEWLKSIADKYKAAVTGSLIIKVQGKIFNRLIWMEPGDKTGIYDKRHLFGIGGENEFYSAGDERLIVGYKNWRICPLICYDLRFPVWSRNRNEYDLLIYVANWPAPRQQAWDILTKARAVENQAYVAAANRIGTDGEGINYSGESRIISPKGDILSKASMDKEEFITFEINYDTLINFRKKFPVLADADDFIFKK